MKRKSIMHGVRVTGMLCLLAGATTAFGAPPAAQARLVIDDTSILPATPTGVTVTVLNTGPTVLHLPSALWLTATSEAGQTFMLRSSTLFHEDGGAEVIPEALRTIVPNASAELRFDPSIAVVGSRWFMDNQIWAPGRYRLRAVFSPGVKADGTYDASAAIVSDEQTLTVAVHSADDAAVWRWLREQKWNEQAWLSRPSELARFVMKEHSSSEYALFVALYLPVANDQPSPAFDELIKRFPAKSFTEQVKLRRIFHYQQSSTLAYRHADLYRAVNDAEAGRELASGLVQSSHSSTVRAAAKDYLDHIPTRERLMEKPESR